MHVNYASSLICANNISMSTFNSQTTSGHDAVRQRFIVLSDFIAWPPGRKEQEAHLAMLRGFDLWVDPNQEGNFIRFEFDLRYFETDRQTFLASTRLFHEV